MSIGPNYLGHGECEFVVWAPFRSKVELEVVSPRQEIIPLTKDESGYWRATAENIPVDSAYRYRLDGELSRPDPASHFQPEGVHGPSRLIHPSSFRWDDDTWKGIDLARMVIYELHVGTFTPEGTFESIIPRLDKLKQLGVNTIELMPVAQFPGERNWGYDGVYPFAVQNSYGGAAGLKKLVNECHKRGMSVILDVVYNHLGPEGNYLADFGPYFTERYKTPWGRAINFDGPHSDAVRNFFIENALYWFEQFHIDVLRLDAVHAIYDSSAHPFLQELVEHVQSLSTKVGSKHYLIAESNLNDPRIIRPRELGGFGIDAQWNDDFHHCVHTLLTGERSGYYEDFGTLDQLVKCLREGFVYTGQFSRYRQRRHGNSSIDRPAAQFVVCTQNHDQVGNRMLGERLSKLVTFEQLKLAASLTILGPFVPLLFMGEEYAEETPFLYFVSHSDHNLIDAVRKGRGEEFEKFAWAENPPDPQSIETFKASRIRWDCREEEPHSIMLDFYKQLLTLRRELPALAQLRKDHLDFFALEDAEILVMRRWYRRSHVTEFFNLGSEDVSIKNPLPAGKWRKLLDSADPQWGGPGELLPDLIKSGETLIVRKHSVALFKKSAS